MTFSAHHGQMCHFVACIRPIDIGNPGCDCMFLVDVVDISLKDTYLELLEGTGRVAM